MEHDSGECAIAPNVQLGYLEQTGTSGSTLTIYEEATSKMETLNRLKKTLFGDGGEDEEYALHASAAEEAEAPSNDDGAFQTASDAAYSHYRE